MAESKYPGVKRRCGRSCPATCRKHKWGWYAEVGKDPATGRRVQLTRSGFDSAKEAWADRQDAVRQYQIACAPIGDRTTRFYDYIVAWIDQGEKDGELRPTTVSTYRRHARLYVQNTPAGSKPVGKITAADVEALVRGVPQIAAMREARDLDERQKRRQQREAARNARRAARGLPPLPSGEPAKPRAPRDRKRTAGAVYSLLSSALGHAERHKSITVNPCRYVEYRGAKSKRRADIVWTLDQLRAFCAAAVDHDLGYLFVCATLTGLRRGELCALRWADVDLGKKVLRVNSNRTVVDWKVAEGDAKSEAGEARPVALDSTSLALLTSLQHWQKKQRLALGEVWTDSGRVFTRPNGTELHPGSVTKAFTAFLATLDLPRTTLHGLRHISAMLGMEAGETLLQACRRLGHSDIRVTGNMYGHVFHDAAARVAEQRAALLEVAL